MLISEVFNTHVTHYSKRLLGAPQWKLRALFSQRQRLIQSSKNQKDGEAGPGSRGGSTSNSLRRTGSCSLENGGRGPGVGDAESGDKPGGEACQPEEEEDDEDGIFSPVRIPGEEEPALLFQLDKSLWKLCLIFCCHSQSLVDKKDQNTWLKTTICPPKQHPGPYRKLLCAGEVGDHVASGPAALLHCA